MKSILNRLLRHRLSAQSRGNAEMGAGALNISIHILREQEIHTFNLMSHEVSTLCTDRSLFEEFLHKRKQKLIYISHIF